MSGVSGLLGLFLASLLAATLVPAQSESVLVGLLALGNDPWWLLLVVASIGNTLGAVINWACGRFLIHFQDRRWFPVSREAYDKARRAYLRWGLWSLLFAWVPFVGDPLTVAAGALRVRIVPFVLLVGTGKTARYAVLVAATLSWI